MSIQAAGWTVNRHSDSFHTEWKICTKVSEEKGTPFSSLCHLPSAQTCEKGHMRFKEANTYVNSDLISKLRHRMYLIHSPKSYLERFKNICVCSVKRLAHLALSTPTDLLIAQGLYNIENLQSAVRAEFMQNCLQGVDTPCRLTSQRSYTHLKYNSLKGISCNGWTS
jgi:hypothetical protein